MDKAPDTDAHEMTPLEMRRARLRAFADGLLDSLEAADQPKTHIDIERAARAAMVLDRLIGQLFGGRVKTYAPSPSFATPRAAASDAPRSRLPSLPSADDQGESLAGDVDEDDALTDDDGMKAWEERFQSRLMSIAEVHLDDASLKPELQGLISDLFPARAASP